MNIQKMNIHLSEIVDIISAYSHNGMHCYIYRPSGRIMMFSDKLLKDSDLFDAEVVNNILNYPYGITQELKDAQEFITNPELFCAIPTISEIGIEQKVWKFLKDNTRVGMPLLNNNVSIKKLWDYFFEYLKKFNLEEKWLSEIYELITDFSIKWCIENEIDYLNDVSDDIFELLGDKTYVLSISLCKGCYRHIKVSNCITLYDLHSYILESFDFDDDHAHVFFMNNKAWDSSAEYGIPEISEGCRDSGGVYLGEFQFEKGDKFIYIFDFGECWQFTVKFLREIDEECVEPEIIKLVGEAPPQYNYED